MITSGFAMEENHDVTGKVSLGLSSATPIDGAGVVGYITFLVTGAEGATSALTLSAVSLNDGLLSAEISHGQLVVNQLFDISGDVTYYSGSTGVPRTELRLQSATQYTTGATASNGAYAFSGLYGDTHTLTPLKSGDSTAITAYDASLALQSAVGNRTLSDAEKNATDVNGNGEVTSFDASSILRHTVGLSDLPFAARATRGYSRRRIANTRLWTATKRDKRLPPRS